MELTQQKILLVALVAYVAWRWFRFRKVSRELPTLLQEGAVIVDVRTRREFSAANNPQSVNIPLDELGQRLNELDRSKPVVLCCASGSRSAIASSIFKRSGFKKVLNAGPWKNTLQAGA